MKTTEKLLRKCIVSHDFLPKKALVRVVRQPDGIRIDPTGKLAGRGAYMRMDIQLIPFAQKKKAFERALKTALPKDFYEQLQTYMMEKLSI